MQMSQSKPQESGLGLGSALPDPTRLVMVRHGETDWNKARRMQGQEDVELNAEGIMQAATAAQALELGGLAEKVDAIVSSDLWRAVRTADILATVCPQAKRIQDPRLREVHFGDLQGRYTSEIGSGVKDVVKAWGRGNFDRSYPGGENADQLISRGMAALQEAANLGRLVLVVSHGMLMKWCAVHIELAGAPPAVETLARPGVAAVVRAKMANCACTSLTYEHQGGTFRGEQWFVGVRSVPGWRRPEGHERHGHHPRAAAL